MICPATDGKVSAIKPANPHCLDIRFEIAELTKSANFSALFGSLRLN